MAPNEAVRLSMLRISCFSGITTLPENRNSSTSMLTAMIAPAHGSRLLSMDLVSTWVAASPPTRTSAGADRARTERAYASPAEEPGSTSETTESQLPPAAPNAAAPGPGGAAWLPPTKVPTAESTRWVCGSADNRWA